MLISSSESILNTDKSAYEKLVVLLHKERNIERGCLIGQMARDRRIIENAKLGEEVTRGFNWMKQFIEELVRVSISDGSISNTLAPLEATMLIRPHLVNFTDKLNFQIIQWKCCYPSWAEFFRVRTTALMLICNARAVSRIPELFMARSTTCSFIPA